MIDADGNPIIHDYLPIDDHLRHMRIEQWFRHHLGGTFLRFYFDEKECKGRLVRGWFVNHFTYGKQLAMTTYCGNSLEDVAARLQQHRVWAR